MSIPLSDCPDDPESDGDSDASSDASSDAPAYEADYRPISADADSDADDSAGYVATVHSNGGDHNPTISISLYDRAENGVSRLDLNGDGMHAGEQRREDEEEDQDEEREREREAEASMSRAFSEDESRRSAPLSRENAARVMEAMRGVSFSGCPPDWVGQVPEDRWIDHLRRLRSGEPARAPQS